MKADNIRETRNNWNIKILLLLLSILLGTYATKISKTIRPLISPNLYVCMYEGWNFNSGNYLFTADTK